MNLYLPHIYHRELYFHVSINLAFHNIIIALSVILIEKCSFQISCQSNAKSAIDPLRLDDRPGHI